MEVRDGRTIFFASWGLAWRVGGGEVVAGFVFDIGGSWDGSAEGCWAGFGPGDEDMDDDSIE